MKDSSSDRGGVNEDVIRRVVREAVDARVAELVSPYLDLSGLAELTGYSVGYARRWAKSEGLSTYKIGRLLRYKRDEVEALLKRKGAA